jgi:cytochrome c556
MKNLVAMSLLAGLSASPVYAASQDELIQQMGQSMSNIARLEKEADAAELKAASAKYGPKVANECFAQAAAAGGRRGPAVRDYCLHAHDKP